MPRQEIEKSFFSGAVVCARLLCLLLPSLLFAQQDSLKWGEVPRADLEMAAFPEDSNAAAVILGDLGAVSFDNRGMIFTRHRRIKILSNAGFHWGNFAIPFFAKNWLQQVSHVQGQTLRLAADGSIACDTLDQKSIFDEDVDGEYRRIRFTLPGISPGAVVEYRYQVVSKNYAFLHDWEFQTSEPTRYSEFCAEIPNRLEYVMVHQGISAFDVEESRSGLWLTLGPQYGQITAGRTLPDMLTSTVHCWGMRNMPALRAEPFMTTPDDFSARIRFQLSKITRLGESKLEFMNSWEKVAEELMKAKRFGQQIARHDALRRQAEKLILALETPEEKMRAIYDYVRSTMTWNGKRGIYADEDLDKAFKARRGGGPEIALMLTAMLRFAGLEAHPALISTRDNGKIVRLYSIATQFNHVLTYVKLGDREHLLDATDRLRPYDLLPVAALNEAGWVVDAKNPKWIDIPNTGSFQRQIVVIANLAADGSISGHFLSSAGGYHGLFERDTLRHKKENDYIRDRWLGDLADARLDSFKISNRDSTSKPLMIDAFFSSPNHAQVAGDKIYFNPLFFGRSQENPFKRAKRTFPVDFAYTSALTYTLNLALPDGCVIEELPKNMAIKLPNDDAQFQRLAQVEDNQLQFMSQFVLRKPRFEPEEYERLREFYDRVVAAQAELVVLKRSAATAAAKKN
jgi:transglutaminase-like putative cysteine protease